MKEAALSKAIQKSREQIKQNDKAKWEILSYYSEQLLTDQG